MRSGPCYAIVIAYIASVVAQVVCADVPAPPVNQSIGMLDVVAGEMRESDCRVCHGQAISNRHHLLYGRPIPPGSTVPYPDSDRDGRRDTIYGCLNCHNQSFSAVTNCIVCHTSSAHHATPAAKRGDCASCHGDIVDSVGDGHYIPKYSPTFTTPTPSDGDGLPLNRYGNGAGACNYCHDQDDPVAPFIQNSADLHHSASMNCLWCHSAHGSKALYIRACENCHGPDSLHSIQADSPAPGNIGTVVVGGEYAGYGHVGRDAGPGDSDCWGCHGFATPAPVSSGRLAPAVYATDVSVVAAGKQTTIMVAGAALTNVVGNEVYESEVALTAADGTSVVLTPDVIFDEGTLAVTIPASTPAGNYALRAVKHDVQSNPVVITVTPPVRIKQVAGTGRVTITGSGFGDRATSSATAVTGRITALVGKKTMTKDVRVRIVSWNNTKIVADFDAMPDHITVRSIFGSATSALSSTQKQSTPAAPGSVIRTTKTPRR